MNTDGHSHIHSAWPLRTSNSILRGNWSSSIATQGGSLARTPRPSSSPDGLRIVLIALKARSRIPEHHTEGQISIQTVAGHIKVRAQGRSFHLPAGGLLALGQGLPHDVEALEESAFLLTIAWPSEKDRPVL